EDDTVVVNVDGDAGPTATPTVTQCNDNIDNDGDGEYDFDGGPNGEPVDQSCTDEADNDESDLLPTETPPEATATPTSTPEGTQLPGTSCAKVNFVAAVNTDGTATVKNNNNEPCTVHLTSYNIWKKRGGTPPHYLTAQTIFKTISRRLNAGQEATLSVELPACYSQIDLTRAPPMQPPTPNGGEDVLAFNFGPFSSGYCDDPQATAPPTTATPAVCPATAPTGLNSLISTGNSLLLRWTPGTGSSFQQLRFGPNQAEVNSGCQAVPTTCLAVEHNLPATQNEYNIPAGRLTAGTTYYWRIVNLNQGPPVCFKDAAATYSAPGATVTPTATPLSPVMTIVKTVANVTQGSSEADLVAANPTETVEFTIRVTAQNGTVQNVNVSDVLPFGLTYVAGSTIVNGNSVNDGLVGTGIAIGNLTNGQTAIIKFRAQVLGAASFSSGTTTLTNTATATSSNTPPVNDTAFVNVTVGQLVMSLQKTGRNVTSPDSTGDRTSVIAKPNETIEFTLRVKNLSAAQITNVIVSDVLPTGLTYIAGTTTVDGVAKSDGIIGAGLNIGSLAINQEAVIKFQVKVGPASAFPIGNTTLINTAKAKADGVSEIIAQMPIIIANGAVGGAGQVPTGTGESLLLALAVSLIITLMYMTYTRTEAFRRREVKSIIKHGQDDHDFFDFKG
ncbi:MAG: DUF11 domain-containing protein, partial [Candidatus Yanofskybacteria bacterium]|nr:DUF11 domain-containing protein [Candidatus Yanofskybacteria bacterium]